MKKLLLLLLCCCLLAGCNIGGNAPYQPTGSGLTWDDDYTGPSQEVTAPQNDQALSIAYYPEQSMNPLICTDFTNRAIFSLIYQGLFAVNRDYQISPILCKQYARSEDMKTYTFYLESATFSDSTPLTAQDVVATYQTAKQSGIYQGRFQHVQDIAVSPDGGITFSLDTAYENLPVLLDIPILKASELDAPYPLGTGPYILEVTASQMRLRRQESWWCSANMAVTASAISLVPAESPTQIRDEFEFSDLSLVCADPGSDKYADFRCDFELWDCENGIFLYLACNMDSKVFSIPEIRSALTYAIDRDTIAATHYRGFARSTTLPVSPLSPYYSQKLADSYAYDAVKFAEAVNAAALLQEEPLILLVNSDDSLRVRVARDIRDMLKNCGLSVQMKELSTEDYQYALKTGSYDLYLGQTKLSANMDLSAFFYTAGALNYGNLSNVSIYSLCLESLANHGNYYTLHQKIMENGLLCPILFRSYAIYADRGLISGLTPARDNVFYYSLGKTMDSAFLAG